MAVAAVGKVRTKKKGWVTEACMCNGAGKRADGVAYG